MRKLKLEIQISIDGFIADNNGKTDWLECNWADVSQWDNGLIKYFNEITETVDCILLSRKMAKEGFIDFWKNLTENSEHPLFELAQKITTAHKVVFTKTIGKSEWDNTEVANDELVDEIKKLKNKNGKDIIVYGGATFVSSLIKLGLIDEFHLFINPTALGNGKPIFEVLENKQSFNLIKTKPFECGIIVLHYEPKRN
ncbi:dihydrofolate reductase [Flavobacterium psychrophilum]|nr:dihydrofolate reductase [Flavobacterium psychrophilum]EKT4510839.1 dihydrofolate reductase [Flavobacterium psychrophilum]